MKLDVAKWVLATESKFCAEEDALKHRALHPAMAEIAGMRLMRALGIGTAPSIKILEREQVQFEGNNREWVFKAIHGDRLRLITGPSEMPRWVLAVQKIPKAIPLSFLRRHYGIVGERWDLRLTDFPEFESLSPLEYMVLAIQVEQGRSDADYSRQHDPAFHTITDVLYFGKKELPNAKEFYSDFCPPDDWTQIRRAIAWDSTQSLAIHAARLFFGATAAHPSNLLVDGSARLYSIDHELCVQTDGAELPWLFDSVKPGTRAFKALGRVAELTDEEVRGLFENPPEVAVGPAWFRWPLGSREKTEAYYRNRLHTWKWLFAKGAP